MADALAKLLEELDLAKYAATFASNEVDLASAKLLSEQELGELGLALGARKKLYAALHAAPSAATVPTTTTPPAAATASQPASPIKITNISAWDWLFDSDKWCSFLVFISSLLRRTHDEQTGATLLAATPAASNSPPVTSPSSSCGPDAPAAEPRR